MLTCPHCREQVLSVRHAGRKHFRVCPVMVERRAKAALAAQVAAEAADAAKVDHGKVID